MDMSVIKQLALGGIPPAIAGAILYFALAPKNPATAGALLHSRFKTIVALVLTFAIVIGIIALAIALPAFKFATVDNRLPWAIGIVLVGTLVASLSTAGRRTLARIVIGTITLAAATAFGLLSLVKGWTTIEAVLHIGGAAAAGGIIAWAVGPASTPTQPTNSGPALARILVPLIGASQLLVLGMSSLKHGQIAGMFAAIAGGAAAAWLVRRSVRLGVGPSMFLWLGAMLITIFGMVLGSAPIARAALYGALVVTSMIFAAVATMGPLGKLSGWKAWTVSIAFPALPIAAGMALAALTIEDASEY
ncbi:MAG: hypothetical protein PSX37_10970 [bacterium]|nr:hypothetical protein [bacterium]